MKKKENNNRWFTLNETTLNQIKEKMKQLRYKKVTHIYKYTCPTSLKFKFLNAIPKSSQQNENRVEDNFEKIDGDEVTHEWLHFNTVVLNKCTTWYK